MPDRATISRVAKILARATSPEPGEAQTALEHAYKRMARDGVTLADLLTLPEEELFQEALVGLVQVILANQPDLSPATRREVYSQYLRLITDKFNAAGQGGADATQEREEAARDYRQRNGYQDESPREEKQENDNTFTQKNRKTNNRENDLTGFQFRVPKSMAQVVAIVRPWFERGGVLWLAIHEPVLVLRMLAASMLWGMGFAVVVIISAAIVHALTGSSPWIDVRLKNLFAFLTALGTLWRMRLFLTKN
jgi:hypothetical protein